MNQYQSLPEPGRIVIEISDGEDDDVSHTNGALDASSPLDIGPTPNDPDSSDSIEGSGAFDDEWRIWNANSLAEPALADAPEASQPIDLSVSRFGGPKGGTGINDELVSIRDDLISGRSACIDSVAALFPGICRDYVSELYDNGVGQDPERLVAYILDRLEKNIQYPLAKDTMKILKRKRETDEDRDAAAYESLDRPYYGFDYGTSTRTILSAEFSKTPMNFIDQILRSKRNNLYPTYQVLHEIERNWNATKPAYHKLKTPRKSISEFLPDVIEATIHRAHSSPGKMIALRELQAARRTRQKVEFRALAEQRLAQEEEENRRNAEKEGQIAECGCCFTDHPLNRMVHCDDETTLHWFCRACAKKMAEAEIGISKYELKCMSMDGCDGIFRRGQISQFLDQKTIVALDRNEQEAMLRMAGIENLASCPFCPFAAEYPPVGENSVFKCHNPDCEKESCRLCNLESHVPKSCAEHKKDCGLSIRRQIEEAMSAAMIRKCNKCGTPFIKEEGCNKMTCTLNGCRNIQCYVCSKSCGYDHFNDTVYGGKPGNCPLYENVAERHEQEVKRAERIALDKIRAEHPEYTEEDLKIKVSETVERDEQIRKHGVPRIHPLIHQFQRPQGMYQPNFPQAQYFAAPPAAGNLANVPQVQQALNFMAPPANRPWQALQNFPGAAHGQFGGVDHRLPELGAPVPHPNARRNANPPRYNPVALVRAELIPQLQLIPPPQPTVPLRGFGGLDAHIANGQRGSNRADRFNNIQDGVPAARRP